MCCLVSCGVSLLSCNDSLFDLCTPLQWSYDWRVAMYASTSAVSVYSNQLWFLQNSLSVCLCRLSFNCCQQLCMNNYHPIASCLPWQSYPTLDVTSHSTWTSTLPLFTKSISSFALLLSYSLLPPPYNGFIHMMAHLCTTLFEPFISTSNNLSV